MCRTAFLVSIFLDDIELFFQDLCLIIFLFLDDIPIFAMSSIDLNNLHEYCSNWNLKMNTNKSKIMAVMKRGCLKLLTHTLWLDAILK